MHIFMKDSFCREFSDREAKSSRNKVPLLSYEIVYRNAASEFSTPLKLLSRDWGKY